MKATIRTDGTLSVIPESELEAYALSQWWANYQQGDNCSGLQVLFNKLCFEPPTAELEHQMTTQEAWNHA